MENDYMWISVQCYESQQFWFIDSRGVIKSRSTEAVVKKCVQVMQLTYQLLKADESNLQLYMIC